MKAELLGNHIGHRTDGGGLGACNHRVLLLVHGQQRLHFGEPRPDLNETALEQPARALGGEGVVLVSRFDFAAMVDFPPVEAE